MLSRIAKASKSDGTDGAVIISFLSIDPEDLDISEPVFVYFDGLPVPFFIESFARKGSGREVVHLTGVRSFEDAEELVGKEIFVEDPEGDFGADEDLRGWKIYAPKLVGTVKDFLDIPGNPCLEVEREGAEDVIIPLNEDLIVSVNEKKRELKMRLPEGLI